MSEPPASDLRYRALFETARDGILIVNDEGRYVDVNESFCRIVGVPRDQLVGRHFSEFIPPERLAEAVRRFGELQTGDSPTGIIDFPLRAADGRTVELEWSATPGYLPGLHFCTCRHVPRFHLLANTAPVLIWESGPDKLCTWFNQRWLEFTGRTIEQELGNGWAEGVHPDDLQRCLEIYVRSFDARKEFEMEYRLRRHDGEYRWILDHGIPQYDGAGEFAGCIGTCIDITERRLAEDAVAASEARLRAYFESASQGILSVDEHQRIEHVNAKLLDMFGYEPDELNGAPLDILLPESSRAAHAAHVREFLKAPRSRPIGAGLELSGRRKDGREFPVEIGLSFVRIAGAIRGIAFVTDITDRKRIEDASRESQKLESLGVLAGGIAHDFNNLLVGIMGNASLLECSVQSSDEREILAQLVSASQRAADLTRQLLAYTGKGRLQLQPVDLSELVREIAALLRASVPRNVHLRMNLTNDLPMVQGDPAQLHQVVMNFILNGAEAIPAETPGTVTVSTRLVEDEDGRHVALEVRDTGVGMDDETRARIFDPFFTTKFLGRGLGLSAVQGIVRSHGGILRVSSRPGEETAFQMLLAPIPAAVEQPPAEKPEDVSGAGTVLVVDDEEAVRRMARAALERYGFRVLLAENGREALEIYRRRPGEIDLVLLDLAMPEMGGEETLRRLREISPEVLVLLTTGYSGEEAVQRLQGKGLAGFIQKPYPAATLARHVKAAMEKKHGTDVPA